MLQRSWRCSADALTRAASPCVCSHATLLPVSVFPDSDTDTGGASKRTLASGEGGRDAVRGRGDDARKDEDLGDGERVTNENIMNMLRSIKDSLSLLTPAGVPRTTAGVGRMVTIQQMPSPLEGGAAASAEPLKSLGDTLTDEAIGLAGQGRMQEALEQGADFIASALACGGTVLVHCRAGISRSATLAIAHLVRSTQQPVDVVFEKVRLKRRVVDPNLGYWVALKTWERRVLPAALLRVSSSRSFGSPGRVGAPSFGSPSPVRPLSRVG